MSAANNTPDQDSIPEPSKQTRKVVQPLPGADTRSAATNPAADLIRQKLDELYKDEPSAKEEIAEVEEVKHRSKHQQFMHELSHSGKSLAEIQTAWHAYYTGLPDSEKHQVWQEFYSVHEQQKHEASAPQPPEAPTHSASKPSSKSSAKKQDSRTVGDVKEQLIGKVTARGRAQRKHHVQSLMFGLGMGVITLLIFLFGFFNERFIAPFITPARAVSSTPIIIDPSTTAVSSEPKIIIPKINVEIPIDFEEPTIDEAAIQRALEKGVVHYPTTPEPGEIGNGVIFGHSANNILNRGKYKFAFVLLKRLENGDTFYVQKGGKRYVYKVFDKKVVSPSEVSVLYPSYPDRSSTFTLITCDPPGTSLNRLVVVGEQISPDPSANVASSVTGQQTETPEELPSNSITLWQRIKNWLEG
jgi:LPXTG-site transpeptidase (sortase) family protein